MISNAISNSNGAQKVAGGEAPSNPELISNGSFEEGQEGWLVVPTVNFKGGVDAIIGPAERPPYAAIGQAVLENGLSYNVVIEVEAISEEATYNVLDGSNESVYNITSTGTNSFSFTNSEGTTFSIAALFPGEGSITITNVSVKKS
tara:strand:+ start:4481 stop:4918 length:438 start_codon:yes stop_codon:yes gene_type:complete